MNDVILGIGSNIDPETNIPQALEKLAARFRLVAQSDLIRTKPVGMTDQPDFLNAAVRIETDLSAAELKTTLKTLEDQLGRDRSKPKDGPRAIDLDIVVFNGQVVDPDVRRRDYLQLTVRQVAPELGGDFSGDNT
ncbi:MAG: 2-amino-4-hydroxy-6-hydroxymethyldihydropteridine diphosphokinase [Phycisphaerae bacterium]